MKTNIRSFLGLSIFLVTLTTSIFMGSYKVNASPSQPQPNGTNFSWVSPTTSSPNPDNYHSRYEQISYDGRYVVYQSISSDLVSGDTNTAYDIFVKDNQAGTTERVSVDNSGAQLTGDSSTPLMSSDGRYVAYNHKDSSNIMQTYVRDRTNGTTTLASSNSSGTASDKNTTPVSISSTGVVLESVSSCNLTTVLPVGTSANCLYLKTLSTGAIQVLPFVDPTGNGDTWTINNNIGSLSSDGTVAVLSAFDSTTNYRVGGQAIYQVVAVNLSSNTAQIASTPSSGSPTNYVTPYNNGGISRNGRYVVFTSRNNHLLSGTVTAYIYMRDLQTNTLTAIDPAPSGRTNNGYDQNMGNPMVSDDGRYVGFDTLATNLDPSYNPTNVFGTSLYVRDTTSSTTKMVVNQIVSEGAYAPGSNTFAFQTFDSLASGDSGYADVYQTFPD